MRGNRRTQIDVSLLKGPVRTCISCRKKDEVSNLYRLVRKKDGEVVLDKNRILPGRGAHICQTRQCLTGAVERKAVVRSFKREILLDKKALESTVF